MKRQSPKAAAANRNTAGQISTEERYRLIAEAAYYRALGRGFQGGDPLDDWCVAEQEVNASLLSSTQAQKTEDRGSVRSGAPVGVGRNGARSEANKGNSPTK